jgi:6-pyruvoyltetrahydropterin/6-carboxytetrahydropterin synthase
MSGVLTVTREFEFCAAHYLPGHIKCGKMHGHNYRVLVTLRSLESDMKSTSMVMDFSLMRDMVNPVLEQLDHGVLNEERDFTDLPPTAENIARWLFQKLDHRLAMMKQVLQSKGKREINAELLSIRVYETPKCYAEYTWRAC